MWISDLLFHIWFLFPNRFVQLISKTISHNQLYRGNFHKHNKALDTARRSITKISSFQMIYPSFHFQTITGNSRNHQSNLYLQSYTHDTQISTDPSLLLNNFYDHNEVFPLKKLMTILLPTPPKKSIFLFFSIISNNESSLCRY